MNFLVDVVDLSKQFTFFPVNQSTARNQIAFSTEKVTPLVAIFMPRPRNLQTCAWGDFVPLKHVQTKNNLQLYTQC